MPNYILRDLPQNIWDDFKARALRDQWHLRALFLQLMIDYGRNRITPSKVAPPTPAYGFSDTVCPQGHQVSLTFKSKADARPVAESGHVFCITCGTMFPLDEQQRATLESWVHTADL